MSLFIGFKGKATQVVLTSFYLIIRKYHFIMHDSKVIIRKLKKNFFSLTIP